MQNPKIIEAENAKIQADNNLRDVRGEITKENRAMYASIGGCTICLGAGWTVQHYHDGDSVHDRCVCNPGEKRYPYNPAPNAIPYAGDHAQTPDQIARLESAMENAQIAADYLARANQEFARVPGATVRVMTGRKIKIGTEGTLTGIYHKQLGYGREAVSAGIKLASGEIVYTPAHNVMVIAGAIAQVEELPELYGSEKQVRWANSLRDEAIKSGRVTLATLKAREDYRLETAKYWIESRVGAK